MRYIAMLSAVLILCVFSFAEATFATETISAETANKIVTLARDGKNIEAIKVFEGLPENTVSTLVVMRSVAGCYWREKMFDKSREMYQQILDRRPTLQSMSDNPQTEPTPLLAKLNDKPVKADKVSEKTKSELARLREANAKLTKERDNLRKSTAEKISSVTEAAKLSASASQKMRDQIEDANAKRLASEKVTEQIQKSMESQSLKLNNKVAELEKMLKSARSEIDANSAAAEKGGDDLLKQLEKAQADKKSAEKKSETLQAKITTQQSELSTRIAALEKSLKDAQNTAATVKQSVEERNKLSAELEKAQAEKKAADSSAAEMKKNIEKQKEALNAKVADLEKSLEESKGEVSRIQKANQSRVEELEKAISEEKKERGIQEEKAKEIQMSLEKSGTELHSKIAGLKDKLQIAEMEVSESRAEMDKRKNEDISRVDELKKQIADLEQRSKSAKCDVASLSAALEKARLANAELSAKRSATKVQTTKEIKKTEETSFSRALAEIDKMEREYEELDNQADERQYELLARIDTLEQSTVTGANELKDVKNQLKMERALRKEMKEQSDKRDGMLLDANKLLAEATEKIAKEYDEFQAQMKSGKLKANVKTPSDLAPLIGKLEDSTSSAAIEVKKLHETLAKERKSHSEEMQRSKTEIMNLRREVEALKQTISVMKAESAEQEKKWLAEAKKQHEKQLNELMDANKKQIAGINSANKKHVAELNGEIADLGSKIKASSKTLKQMKSELNSDKEKYAKLEKTTSEAEAALHKRIHDLELAFAIPETNEASKVTGVRAGDPKLDAKVDDLYQSIIDTSRMNKSLAISQYESLPKESVKPIELIKTVANLYRDKKDYDTAYKLYEEILVRDPGNLYAERKLVMTLFDMGKYDEALARLAGKSKNGDSTGKSN